MLSLNGGGEMGRWFVFPQLKVPDFVDSSWETYLLEGMDGGGWRGEAVGG